MMKKLLLAFVVLFHCLYAFACTDDKEKLDFRPTKVVLLLDDYICGVDQWIYCRGFKNWISGNETCIFDSVKVNKGQHRVELNFSIPYVVGSKLIFGKRGPSMLEIVTEPDSVLVMRINDGDLGVKEAERGNAHNEYYEFISRNKDYKLRCLAMRDDSEKEQRDALQEEWYRYVVDCLSHTSNPEVASGCIASLRVNFVSRLEELDSLMTATAEKFRLNKSLEHYAGVTSASPEKYRKNNLPASPQAQQVDKRLEEIMKQAEQIDTLDTSVGNQLFVSFLDSTGNRITPRIGKGKYVLIDFWASWCKPCRQEIPILKQAVQKYKEHFSVFAVSLDINRYAWKKAIQVDGTQEFTHALGLFPNGNPLRLVRELGINDIPRNFLIDDQHRIVAKDLRGEELMQVLDSLLSE